MTAHDPKTGAGLGAVIETGSKELKRSRFPAKPPGAWKSWAVAAVLLALTALSAWAVGADIRIIVRNWSNASGTLVQLFQPDYSFFVKTIPALVQTVQMAIIATAVASLASLPLSFLVAKATNPSPALLRVCRWLLNITRAVPDLLYAAIFVAMVGTGALGGIMALVMFNAGILIKMLSESIDGLDQGAQEAALAAGATWAQADRAAVLPDVLPAFVSQTIYVFELNIRVSTVIGLVGAGGLGMLIDEVRNYYKYHHLSMIIFEILVIVVVLDFVSSYARKRLAR